MPRLTKRFVESARPATEGEQTYWDSDIPAFGLRTRPSGAKTYVLMYRVGGRLRKATLGQHGVLTPLQARERAQRMLAAARDGKDTAGERLTARQTPTLAQIAIDFLADGAKVRGKKGVKEPRSEGTATEYRRLLDKHILPELGRLKVANVTLADVSRLHDKLRGTPFQANRALEVVSAMLTWAEKKGYRPRDSNPCTEVDTFPEPKRDRFLSPAELGRLGDVLTQAEQEGAERPEVIGAIRLLCLTGCRRGEILGLRWEHVDWEHACLRLPQSKTGPKQVLLNVPALEVLRGLEQRANGGAWVIPGAKPKCPLVNLTKPWGRIRSRAGLDGVRLHDLRHSFASVGVGAGQSLPIIGKLLGHTQAQTTQRYAHLADDPVRAASEAVGKRIAAAMNGEKGEVVPMERAKGRKRR